MMKRREFTERHRKMAWAGALLVYVLFCVLVGYYVGRPMVRFVSEPERFRTWVNRHGLWGDVAFIAMMTVQVLVALIPGEPLEIGAGYAFGVVRGTALCMIGIVIGSAVIFLLVRTLGVRFVEVFFSRKEMRLLSLFERAKHRNEITFLLFFLPGTPKDLVSYLMGLTDIRFESFMMLAAVARIPSVVTSTISGNALGEQNYLQAAIAFAVAGTLSIIGLLIYRKIREGQDQKAPKNRPRQAGKDQKTAEYTIVTITDRPEMKERAAQWFHEKWNIPLEAYRDSIAESLAENGPVPRWYLAMAGERIVGGLGVIQNDFHDRPDLAPNVCAVYTEPDCRGRGIAGALLQFVCDDMKRSGIDTLYLVTDHTSFYERYGWAFLCTVHDSDGGTDTRMYIHR